MDLFPIMVLVIALAGSILLAFWFASWSYGQSARRTVVRNRIRRDVQEEFQQELGQCRGVRKWLLVLRREAEISRRAGKVIHGR